MRSVLIVGGSARHNGGAEQFIERASEALRRHGGWTVERLPTNSAYLTLRGLGPFLSSLLTLLLSRRTSDCTWVQYGSMPDLIFVAVAKLRRHRVMVTPHLGVNWRSQSNPILGALSSRLLSFADRLALFSASQQSDLKLRGKPVLMIKTFLPEASLAVRSPQQRAPDGVMKLIHAARLSEEKGSFLMVDVCAQLQLAKVPFTAEIIGSADQATFDRLQSKIEKRGVSQQLRLCAYMAAPELLDRMEQADVLVHLSKIDSYPLIVLEALTRAAVPICIDLAGARHIVEQYEGYVVGPARAAEEAAAIIAGLDAGELRRRTQEASRRVIADHDWKKCAAALEEALLDCIASDPTSQATKPVFRATGTLD